MNKYTSILEQWAKYCQQAQSHVIRLLDETAK